MVCRTGDLEEGIFVDLGSPEGGGAVVSTGIGFLSTKSN